MNRLQTINFSATPFRASLQATADEKYGGYFHYHPGVELLYIHQGKGTLVLEQQVHHMEPGDLYLFQPFQLHHVQAHVDEATPYVRTRIQFEPQAFERYYLPYDRLRDIYHYAWRGAMHKQVFRAIPQHYPVEPLIRYHQQKMSRNGEAYSTEEFASLLHQLLTILQDQLPEPWPSQAFAARVMSHSEAVLQWVESHYTEPYRLESLAETLHISKYHLSHTFKRETGSTITDYIQARRMKEACQLLATSRLSVADIGVRVGWPVASHFVQRFKKWMGVTPHQYRKKIWAPTN